MLNLANYDIVEFLPTKYVLLCHHCDYLVTDPTLSNYTNISLSEDYLYFVFVWNSGVLCLLVIM